MRISIPSLGLLVCCACGRSEAPQPAQPCEPATIAGRIQLTGELASARRGTVTVSAWPEGDSAREGAQPLLSRSYEIGDPDWCSDEGLSTHYFGLCDADRVGDASRGLPAELEIEACFDPDGLLSTREGLVSGSALAHNGAKDVLVTISPRIETAQPSRGRKKDG